MSVKLNTIAKQVIVMLQYYLSEKLYTPAIHFEFEGCFTSSIPNFKLDYALINKQLAVMGIEGELVAEYWCNQWEYVSKFNHQSPLREAEYLNKAMSVIPKLMSKQEGVQAIIKPVVWGGDSGKMASGSTNIFMANTRAVHIPNAVQINVSVRDNHDYNLMSDKSFGLLLQKCFMRNSYANSLLFLPEEEAYERLSLKSRYGLEQELCSPSDISGGHQGSIAFYQDKGKHNQLMGAEPLIYDQHKQPIISAHHWQKTARIEHRLGASSIYYNPFINIIFALLNLIDAISFYEENQKQTTKEQTFKYKVEYSLKDNIFEKSLPTSLYDTSIKEGAISLLRSDGWLNDTLNKLQYSMRKVNEKNACELPINIGDILKKKFIEQYQPSIQTMS